MTLTLFGIRAFAEALTGLFGGSPITDVIPFAIVALFEEPTRWCPCTDGTYNLACNSGLVHFDGTDVIRTVEANDITETTISRMCIG
jgi:hypothetical protein